MQELHSKRPKFSKFPGGAYPGPSWNLVPKARVVYSPPTPKLLPPTDIPIENPVFPHLFLMDYSFHLYPRQRLPTKCMVSFSTIN